MELEGRGTGRRKWLKEWKDDKKKGLKEEDGVRQETRLQECAEEQDHPTSSTSLHSQASITAKYKARHRRGNTWTKKQTQRLSKKNL